MSWFIGFKLVSNKRLLASALARSVVFVDMVAAILQVNGYCVHLVVKVDGDSTSAVRSAVAVVWQLLETEQCLATIVQARLGSEIDCLAAVREIERWRITLEKSIMYLVCLF